MKRLALALTILCLSSLSSNAEEHVVNQKKLQFYPNEITVSAGDTILFKNGDRTAHHLMTKAGSMKVTSPLLPPGKDFKIPFPVAGTFTIGCHIHPKMNLTVTVK